MKKIISAILVIGIMLGCLAGCSKMPNADQAGATTSLQAGATIYTFDVGQAQQTASPDLEKVEKFRKMFREVSVKKQKLLEEFATNPEITNEFLQKTEELEEERSAIIDYVNSMHVIDYEYSEINGYSSTRSYVRSRDINCITPIIEIDSEENYFINDWLMYYGKDWENYWSQDFGSKYMWLDKIWYEVIWCENMTVATDGPTQEGYDRVFVNDLNKDAYILVKGEMGYDLFKIMAQANDEVHETDTQVDFEKIEHFHEMWRYLAQKKQELLQKFEESPEITTEFLQEMEELEECYQSIDNYVNGLSVAEYEYRTSRASISVYMRNYRYTISPILRYSNTDGFPEHPNIKVTMDGWLVFPEASVLWTENMNNSGLDYPEDPVLWLENWYNSSFGYYTVKDRNEDAYALIYSARGYQFVHIPPNSILT